MIAGTSSGAKLAWLLLICGLIYLVTASGHFSSTDEEDLFSNTCLLAHQIHLTTLPIGQEFQTRPPGNRAIAVGNTPLPAREPD